MKMAIKFEMPRGPYTVRMLIEALQKCKNQDAPVNVYLLDSTDDSDYKANGRYPVMLVDDGFDDHRQVDLNVTSSLDFLTKYYGERVEDDRTEVDHNG